MAEQKDRTIPMGEKLMRLMDANIVQTDIKGRGFTLSYAGSIPPFQEKEVVAAMTSLADMLGIELAPTEVTVEASQADEIARQVLDREANPLVEVAGREDNVLAVTREACLKAGRDQDDAMWLARRLALADQAERDGSLARDVRQVLKRCLAIGTGKPEGGELDGCRSMGRSFGVDLDGQHYEAHLVDRGVGLGIRLVMVPDNGKTADGRLDDEEAGAMIYQAKRISQAVAEAVRLDRHVVISSKVKRDRAREQGMGFEVTLDGVKRECFLFQDGTGVRLAVSFIEEGGEG